MCAQPSRSRRTTSGPSVAGSNCARTASGRVVTWLSVSAVANSLIRMAFMRSGAAGLVAPVKTVGVRN